MNMPAIGEKLTDREMQCLRLAALGLSNSKIAHALWLQEDTIKTHMRRIFRKLGASNRAHSVNLGWKTGLIGPDTPKTVRGVTR